MKRVSDGTASVEGERDLVLRMISIYDHLESESKKQLRSGDCLDKWEKTSVFCFLCVVRSGWHS